LKILAAAVLKKLDDLVEDAARSREVMDAKEAADFLRLSPSEFRKLARRRSHTQAPRQR
jgi:hypothetical protein